MRRWALNILAALSLVLCIPVVVLWVRSYRAEECYSVAWGQSQRWEVAVRSCRGDIEVSFGWPVAGRTGHFTRPFADPEVWSHWGYHWGDPDFDFRAFAFAASCWRWWYVVAHSWFVVLVLAAGPLLLRWGVGWCCRLRAKGRRHRGFEVVTGAEKEARTPGLR